jgi:hypothetical protein
MERKLLKTGENFKVDEGIFRILTKLLGIVEIFLARVSTGQ